MTNVSLPWQRALEQTLEQRVLHKLAKVFWGTLVLREDNQESICIKCKTEKLLFHRDSVLKNLPEFLNDFFKQYSKINPKQLMRKVVNTILNFQQVYYEALVWEEKYSYFLPFTILNPLTAGMYEASNFIKPNGHFNDLDWVKLFVTDVDVDLYYRFQMACFYCIADKLINLWYRMKAAGISPCECFLEYVRITHATNDLVVLWAYRLENKFSVLKRKSILYDKKFHSASLYEALLEGHMHAVNFFWNKCTARQKQKMLRDYDPDCFFIATKKSRSGIIHFLYSLLSEYHKAGIFELFDTGRMAAIWTCLLQSEFYNTSLNDILTFPRSITVSVYFQIFSSLISTIKKFKYPIHKIIFKILWNHLSLIKQKKILEMSTGINTIESFKEADVLEAIIPLSYPMEDAMNLHDWIGPGRSAVDKISETNIYDSMLRDFVFILIDHNSVTETLTVKEDASFLLECLKREKLISWTGIDESVREVGLNVISILQDTLNVLNDVQGNIQPLEQ